MRELNTGSKNFTKVIVKDEPSYGRACYEYYICRAEEVQSEPVPIGEFGHVLFQKGPIKEFGINGCHHEDLLTVVIDRLKSFQAGEYACRENALALTKLEEALHWLNHRTANRIKRGIGGTDKI